MVPGSFQATYEATLALLVPYWWTMDGANPANGSTGAQLA